MTNETTLGRPTIKPKRRQMTVLINIDLPDQIQEAQAKLRAKGEQMSVSDIHNEAIKQYLKTIL